MSTQVTVQGLVEYRLGEGPLCTVPPGPVQVDTAPNDVTLSWGDGETHQSAAMPSSDFLRYVSSKAIVID